MIYYRYREENSSAHAFTSLSEVAIMLGVWSPAKWQLDLASLAGIIMVIGRASISWSSSPMVIRGAKQRQLHPTEHKGRAAEAAGRAWQVAATTSKIYLSRLSWPLP